MIAYRQCLETGDSMSLQHLAFPNLSATWKNLSLEESAQAAMQVLHAFLIETKAPKLHRVTFVLEDKDQHDQFQDQLFETFPEKV